MPPSFRSFRYISGCAARGDKKVFSCDQTPGQERLPVKRTATILVVDDEKIVVQVMRRILGKGGHEVMTAGSGKEGLDAFKAGGIDLVISDFRMPGRNGLDMLKEIKKD